MRNRRSIEPSLAFPRSFNIALSPLRYSNRSDRYTDFRYFGQLHRLSQPTLIALISANYPKSASVLIWSKLRKSCILSERPSVFLLINQYCQTSKSLSRAVSILLYLHLDTLIAQTIYQFPILWTTAPTISAYANCAHLNQLSEISVGANLVKVEEIMYIG